MVVIAEDKVESRTCGTVTGVASFGVIAVLEIEAELFGV